MLLATLFIIVFRNAEAERIDMIVKAFAATISLDDCPGGWIFEYEKLAPDENIVLTTSKVGFYHCPKGSKAFYLACQEPVTFDLATHPRKFNMVGDVLDSTCSCACTAGNFNWMTMQLVLTDSFGHEHKRYVETGRGHQIELRVVAGIPLTKPGSMAIDCTFSSETRAGQVVANYTQALNESLYVYMAPTNVKPEDGPREPDIPINCISDGEPMPTYKWNCEGNSWKSNDRQLKIQHPGKYFCTCYARNVIDDTTYESMWNGTVIIGAGAERKYLNGFISLASVIMSGFM